LRGVLPPSQKAENGKKALKRLNDLNKLHEGR
jgi:hypothetical protein